MLRIERRTVVLAFIAIALLAVFLRFWRLNSLPPGLYHDEAYNGLDALSLLRGVTFPQFYEGWELFAGDAHAGRPPQSTTRPVFFEGNYGREPLHIYLMALAISWLGATPLAVRSVPAAAGVLTVIATFFAAYALAGPQSRPKDRYLVALLSALTVAVLYPMVHFSRFGIRAMLFVAVETLAVASFWIGINHRAEHGTSRRARVSLLYFLAAGFFLGLSLYTFAAARLLPLLWVLFVPLWFWRERGEMRNHAGAMAGMAGVALLTAGPLLWFFARYPYFFIFRIAYVANKGAGAVEGKAWLTWLLNVGRVARGLLWQGETHLRHNLPGRPYLDLFQAGLFLLGLVSAWRQRGDKRHLFLALWLGVMLLPSILSGDAPHFGRLSGAAPPAAIIVALGAVWLWAWLARRLQRTAGAPHAEQLALAIILVPFLASAVWTANDYFGRYAQHPELARDFQEPDWLMGQAAAAFAEDALVYLTPTQEELATVLFALGDPERLRNFDGRQGVLPAGVPGEPALYLVRPEDSGTLARLQAYFPRGVRGPGGDGYESFSVDGAQRRVRTAREAGVAFGEQVRLVGYEVAARPDALLVTLAWQGQAKMDKNYTAFVHLTAPDGRLLAQQDREPGGYPTSDWRAGEVVVDTFTVPLPEDLVLPFAGHLSTGWYYLPTLEPLGGATNLELPGDWQSS